MELTRIGLTLADRLLKLENEAQHLAVLADLAAAYAHVAREKADTAQCSLSELKVFIALLPDHAALELRAPLPDAADPARRLGVRLPKSVPSGDRFPAPVPRPDREKKPSRAKPRDRKPLRHPLSRLSMMRGNHAPTTRPAQVQTARPR
jgi:hypothetical protein